MSLEFFDVQTIEANFCEFNGPGGTGWQSFFTSTLRPRRVQAIMARNPDSIDHTIQFKFAVAGDGVFIGEVLLPAGCGVGVLPPVDCLTVIAPPQIGAILLPVDSDLQCNLLDALVDTVELDVYSVSGVF